jgi:flagellar basal body rod protein FlgB
MDTHALFTGSIDVLQKSLDVRARKHEVVTSNITNADTPNFKAFELMVEEEIQKQAGLGQHLEMVRTDGSHMPDRNTADEIGVSRKMTTDAFDYAGRREYGRCRKGDVRTGQKQPHVQRVGGNYR